MNIRVPGFGPSAPQTSVFYELLTFPIDSRQTYSEVPGTRTADEAEAYVQWINEVEIERTIYAFEVFDSAGFSYDLPSEDRAGLVEFESWFRGWSQELLHPYTGTHWKLGKFGAEFALPGSSDYSEQAETLFATLAHDSAFVLVDYARRQRSPLKWVLSPERFPRPDPSADPRRLKPAILVGKMILYPISTCCTILIESIQTPPSQVSERSLLADLYDNLIS